ncbi:MAG: tetratricopeptide repeat protein [Acidobacteriota bacterium]|nr:tetratricopeptide repeat protein [Acidobacteriota bacterium]
MIRQFSRVYEFGPFRLNVTEGLLLCDGRPVPLAPKALAILSVLVRKSGCLVEKSELMETVWPDTFVEESNLTQNIFTLRKLLGKDAHGRSYIETVSRRGYRFMAEVREFRDGGLPPAAADDGVSPPGGGRRALTSIAVLPFSLIGEGSGDEYLKLGMADALITRLSNIRKIVLRPTSAVRKYVSHEQDSIRLGQKLGVDAVLEGAIRRRGEHVRITVQLVSVRGETTLWAESFNEKFTDIFAVEDSISEQVAAALILKLTSDEKRRLTKHYTEDVEAYQAYLKGRYFWNKRTEEGMRKGVECFRRAIELDPLYALAYAGLADSYNLLGIYNVSAPREIFPKARAAAVKALEIDDTLAEAHTSLAHVLQYFDWDWSGAEREYRRALELNPDYATTHHWYANYLITMGRHTEAMEEMRRAQRLDPLSPIIEGNIGNHLYYTRRYDQAIKHFQKMLEMEPDFYGTHSNLGGVYEQKGMYEEAISEFEKALALDDNLSTRAWLGHAYAIAGQTAAAHEVINDLKERAESRYISPYDIAMIYVGLGEREQAFAWLDRAYKDRSDSLVWLQIDPRLDSIRSDPRLIDLTERVGLRSETQKGTANLSY